MLHWNAPNSTRRLPSPLVLIIIGLLIGGLGAWLIGFVGGRWVLNVTRTASDYLMLSDTGLQLGMRSDPADIVIVQYGANSAVLLETKATVQTDKAVYENLLSAGAKAVADPRVIAALLPEDFEQSAKPTLEMMSQIEGSNGRLVRDVMVSGILDPDLVMPYADYICHDIISQRSPIDAKNLSRLAPVAAHDQFALRESMDLWLARRYLDLPILSETETKAAVSQSGVAGLWLTVFPGMASFLEGCDAEHEPAPHVLGDTEVTLNYYDGQWAQVAPAAYWIDHTQRADSFPMLDYGAVAKGEFDKSLIKDKLVLIGLDLSYVQPESRFEIPTQRLQVGGPTLVALATQTLINDRVMKPLAIWMYWVPPILLALLVSLLVGRGSVKFAILSALGVLMGYYAIATMGYRSGWFTDLAVSPTVIAATGILTGMTRYGYEIRWRNRMTDMFGRYVPRAVVTDLINKRALQDASVGGKRRDVTVMFADIRGFTRFTEGNQPETVLLRLNEFLQVMVDCTFEQEGTVDKFIGDAILVLFNAPTDQPDHAERAVKTAWAIQKRLSETIDDYENSELRIGIGIHTGDAIVGTVGTAERMEYTAIGSTVNTASRLCDRADGDKVVVSQQVVDAVGDRFQWSQNEPMMVKGIDKPLQTATLIGLNEPS